MTITDGTKAIRSLTKGLAHDLAQARAVLEALEMDGGGAAISYVLTWVDQAELKLKKVRKVNYEQLKQILEWEASDPSQSAD